MSRLIWDETGSRFFETGTKNGVLYPQDNKGVYQKGVAWNGLTGVTESPSGADPTDIYADDMKYATMRSAETFGCTIEAYTYPDEFNACDGSASLTKGVYMGQQARSAFGFSYKTQVSNDVGAEAYKIHILYGCTASPSEKSYTTVNDSPDAITFSWEVTTSPVNVSGEGAKPTAVLVIDSREADPDKLKELEDILYGSDSAEPKLLLPDEVKQVFSGEYSRG